MSDDITPPPESRIRRDDRTVRTLAQVLGSSERGELAFTHFMAARVLVSVSAAALTAPNGWLAFATAANMITRFVGRVDLEVVGLTHQESERWIDRVNVLVEDLRSIDTRPEKVVSQLIPGTDREAYSVHLHVADGPVNFAPGAYGLSITCSAWECSLLAGAPAGRVVPSHTPFGGLAAACFGVAEVFKAVLVRSADEEERPRLQRRLVRSVSYSTWTAAWTDFLSDEDVAWSADLSLNLSQLVQVGAGAVGNATALAFAAWSAFSGVPRLLDTKVVDTLNLNRCMLFRERHVGLPKVTVVAQETERAEFSWRATEQLFDARREEASWLILSTVDNNEVRHQMQEALPAWLVQGSTNGTQVAVSVHSAVDDRSCLVCRHPDPATGTVKHRALTVEETSARLGVIAEVIESGFYKGSMAITPEFLAVVRASDPALATFFEEEAALGRDLCGAVGNFRLRFGIASGPDEPSVPFASTFAGVQAAAEVAKLALARLGVSDVPILDNVLQLDLVMNYTRESRPAFREPPRGDCQLCRQREEQVKAIYQRRYGERPRS